jgi:hypothetical protein
LNETKEANEKKNEGNVDNPKYQRNKYGTVNQSHDVSDSKQTLCLRVGLRKHNQEEKR